MIQVIPTRSNASSVMSNSVTGFFCPLSELFRVGTESEVQTPMPAAGTFRNWIMTTRIAPGAGKSWTFTLRKNGVDTALTVTISDTATTARDTTNSVSFAAGDLISMSMVPTNTPSTAGLTEQVFSQIEFEADADATSVYGGGGGVNLSNSANNYQDPFAAMHLWHAAAVLGLMTSIIALDGAITGYRIRLTAAPTAGKSRTFYIYKNGVKQDGTGGTVNTTITISDSATTGSASFTLPVVADDEVYVETVPSGTPATTQCQIGTVFVATTDGQSQLSGFTGTATPSTTANSYCRPSNFDDDWDINENSADFIGSVSTFAISDLRIKLGGAVGTGGDNYTFRYRKNGATPAGTLTVSITDSATEGEDLTNSVTIEDGDTFAIECDPTGTPTAQTVRWTSIQTDPTIGGPGSPPASGGSGSPGVSVTPFSIVDLGLGGSLTFHQRDLGATRLWRLGDVRNTIARDDITPFNAPPRTPTPHGEYVGAPVNGRGMLPHYGLAMTFDGLTQYVDLDSVGLSLTTPPFSVVALVRPSLYKAGTTRCVWQSGNSAGYLGISSSDFAVFGVNGGTVVTSAIEVEPSLAYLLVGTYDGTNGRLYTVAIDEPGSTVDVAGPTAMSFGAAHGNSQARIGATSAGAQLFAGEIQNVATFFDVTLSAANVDTLHEAAVWTDVSEDVRCPMTWDRGIHSDRPDTRWARTGTFTLGLDNAESNSAGLLGYYTPGHANVRTGFDRGIPIRLSQIVDSVRYIQFIGTIKTIKIDPGEYLQRDVAVMGTDWMDEAAKSSISGISPQQDVTADDVLALLIDQMDNRPHELDLGVGTDTYPIALHSVQDERDTVQTEGIKVVTTEQGLGYVTGDGTFVFEPRTARQSAFGIDFTLEKIRDTDPERSGTQVFNRVKGTVHPVRVDETDETILYSNFGEEGSPGGGQPLVIDHGVEMTIFLPFTDPTQQAQRVSALSIQTPVANVDLFINSQEDGNGIDLVADPTITYSFTLGGNGAYLTILNEWGLRVYLKVRVLGQGVYDYDPVTVRSEDRDSIRSEGLQELSIDFVYLDNPSTAQSLVNYIRLSSIEAPTRLRTVTFKQSGDADLITIGSQGEISSRLAIEEIVSAVDRVFTVNGIRGHWKDGDDVDMTYWLVPTLQTGSEGAPDVWVLGTSALSTNTRLAA